VRRSDNRIYVSNDGRKEEEGASASEADAGSSDSDTGAKKANDRDVYRPPLHALGCCVSAVDAPRGDFMHSQVDDANDAPASASTATAQGRPKRRRIQQVVTPHQAVSLAITVWRLVRDDTGVYYTKDEVIAVHVGLHLRGAFSLAPLTSSRSQILCMIMATHYARLFRQLRHAIALSKYTSHHVAIRAGDPIWWLDAPYMLMSSAGKGFKILTYHRPNLLLVHLTSSKAARRCVAALGTGSAFDLAYRNVVLLAAGPVVHTPAPSI